MSSHQKKVCPCHNEPILGQQTTRSFEYCSETLEEVESRDAISLGDEFVAAGCCVKQSDLRYEAVATVSLGSVNEEAILGEVIACQ
jgi:hypothetical protein